MPSSSCHYRPANMVVSVAGDCTHEAVAADLERRFAGTPGGAAPTAHCARPRRGRALDVVRRPTEQAHLVYGVRSVSRFDERRWALAVLNHVLGGGLSSRLFQKMREQRGLAYSVWSERAAYQDAGSLAVVVGHGSRARRPRCCGSSPTSSTCWRRTGVTERELAVAKGNLRAETAPLRRGLRCPHEPDRRALLLHGEILSVDEVLARIDGVERERGAARWRPSWPPRRAR